MELQALTGQLHIINGQRQEGEMIPGLLAQPAPGKTARGRNRDFLFIHLTLTGSLDETRSLSLDLVDAISQSYYQMPGSVTAALRKAVMDVNQLLLKNNMVGNNVAREGALCCAVLRGDELFMVQTGESFAAIGRNFGVERMPPSLPERVTPLGRTAGLDVRFYHNRLESGDMLLLGDPRLGHLPAQAFQSALVNTEVEIGLDKLAEMIGPGSGRVILVEFSDEPIVAYQDITRPTPRPQLRNEPTTTPSPVRSTRPNSESPSQPLRPQPADLEQTARRATAQTARGLAQGTSFVADVLTRLRPPSAERDDKPAEDEIHWAIPVSISILIPLIIAVIFVGVALRQGEVQAMASIRQEMRDTLAEAENAPDPTLAASQYNEVLALAQSADALFPNDDEVNRMRQTARTRLDAIEGITRLSANLLHTYSEGALLTSVVLQPGENGNIYVLDRANNRVYLHRTDPSYQTLNPATATDPQPEELFFEGQVIGSHIVGSMIDMIWRPQGSAVSRPGLLVLDQRGAGLVYQPDLRDKRAIPLGLSIEWRLPVATTLYNERLYILDVGLGQIWRYFPDGDNYSITAGDQTVSLPPGVNASLAVDLAIYSEDASLLLAFQEGRLGYYNTRGSTVQWGEQDLLAEDGGLRVPFYNIAAAKLVGRGLNQSIFVADPGSGRIVQISRGGNILAQYKATDADGQELFSQITDFDIPPDPPLRMVITAGNKLYIATLE
ncbi:MAG: hypothetical protein IPL78_33565 [Chloroflexi bacterium]|nr:hypothetical protein [Chloroflexota bacterium]